MPRAIRVFAAFIVAAWGGVAQAQSLLERVGEGVSDAAEAVEDAATAPTAAEIDASVAEALETLYAQSPEARNLAAKAIAILVFPRITKGGVMVGGQYGEGAMIRDGETVGYYSTVALSYGLQLGGQRFSYAMFFLNDAALRYFEENDGWEAGAGPTLVGGDTGWSASMGTNDLQGDIAPVFWGQSGLMAGGGLQGTKITRIER